MKTQAQAQEGDIDAVTHKAKGGCYFFDPQCYFFDP